MKNIKHDNIQRYVLYVWTLAPWISDQYLSCIMLLFPVLASKSTNYYSMNSTHNDGKLNFPGLVQSSWYHIDTINL